MADLRLRAQIERLCSDERIKERASWAIESSPVDRLHVGYVLCRTAAAMLARLSPEVRERAETQREPFGAGALEAISRWGRLAAPSEPTR